MFREGGKTGALFVDPLMSDPVDLSTIGETFLYGVAFFLGLTLGVLCEANPLLGTAHFSAGRHSRRLHFVFRHARQVQPDDRISLVARLCRSFLFLPAYSEDAQQSFVAQ
jgi:hypothetical protein